MTTPQLFEHVQFTTLDDLPNPDNGPYIVDTKSGYMVMKQTKFGRVLVPTTESPLLPEIGPVLWTDIEPKLPAYLIGQALSFFQAIYDRQHSEAMVDITWHKDHGYRLFVPPQTASGGGVKATRNMEHYVGQLVGTIHSHCNFDAYHSPTDTHDADGHDGLHITIGDIKKPEPSIALMISMSKIKWDLRLDQVTDGPLAPVPHPQWWERYVELPKPTTTSTTSAYKKPNGHTTVVGFPRKAPPITSIDELIRRYGMFWSEDDTENLLELNDALEEIKDILGKLDIDMDTEFMTTPIVNTNTPQTYDIDPYDGYYYGGL